MMNPWHWTTATLAFVAVSVQGAVLPATAGHLYGRQQPLPTVLYRGSGNSPEFVKELGGFIPRDREGGGEPITNATFGLRSHHIGENRTLYTSTTRDIVMGAAFALQTDVHGWVYQIHPTPNMIDLNESGFEIRFKREEEFSALGGILYNQIQAWAEVSDSSLIAAGMDKGDVHQLVVMWPIKGQLPPLNFTANPDYDTKYDGLSASPGQPQLAGDEANLAKFNEKTLEGYAIEFMEKNGGPVGWDGKFPLSALKADAPAEPTTPKEREDKLCSNSPDDFRMTKAECRTQVAQCVFEESGKANFDWSFITACMDIKWRIV
ncbi:hypothetical protein CCM_05431 [Cordyceps militaris CM01]|uniref:Heat-labile A chain n=1 Tax=Cordyceps militaris (strain CM01) TaxID=983644 RepID=G3JJN3_CORMM|nr:uncharacterized protein CCM_05431 [Cordyceps militaris CM01]EGX91273.1 hypothetical protein CCM_05431 [Cordyceps militaris CM01]